MDRKEEEILRCHKEIAKLERTAEERGRRESTHRRQKELTIAELEEPDYQRYPNRNSSYLLLKPTSDQSSHMDPSQNTSSYFNNISLVNENESESPQEDD